MQREGNYCIIDTVGPDTQGAAKALLWLRIQEDDVAYMVIVGKKSMKNSAAFIDLVGQAQINYLLKNNEIEMEGKTIRLLYRPHNMSFPPNAPVLIVYPSRKLMDKIEENNASNVCVLQWAENEMNYWVDRYNARRL